MGTAVLDLCRFDDNIMIEAGKPHLAPADVNNMEWESSTSFGLVTCLRRPYLLMVEIEIACVGYQTWVFG